MKTSFRRALPRFLLGASGAVALIAASGTFPAVKGVSYRVRVQTQMPNFGGGGGDEVAGRAFGGGQSQLVRVDLAGTRAKVEFQLGNPPGSSLTDYFLMILDSNKVYRVSPDSQTYTDAALGGGFGGGRGRGAGDFQRGAAGGGRGGRGGGGGGAGGDQGRGGRGGGMNPMMVIQDLVITGMKVQTEDLGSGEAIESRPTRRYRVTADYDFKLYGQARTAKTTAEVWTVEFPHLVVDPFEGATAAGDSLSYAGITARLAAEIRKIPGVRVKTVTTQTIPISVAAGAEAEVTPSGQVAETVNIVRTVTITALKEADVDETLLEVPTGYRKVGFGRGRGQ
ncbi:MAG TPA: hypothetical protein VFO55_06245 [Gemmatimonadaceae bacterium]|nr:hypothetical protein [Gemmatimonadaceae bacterium]